MRKYEARIYYNGIVARRLITAKNLDEARTLALNEGYLLTGFGEDGFLENVVVSPIKSKL